jgi:hypothetical protein
MKRQIVTGLFLLTVFFASTVLAQRENCVEFQKLLDATYNFKPAKLTAEERNR